MDRKQEGSAEDVTEIAAQIERYLATHPEAADSLGGITRWWLTRQRYEESAQQVMRAIESLVSAGKVETRTTVDGTVIYAARESSAAAPSTKKQGR